MGFEKHEINHILLGDEDSKFKNDRKETGKKPGLNYTKPDYIRTMMERLSISRGMTNS